jgi:arylformamidase
MVTATATGRPLAGLRASIALCLLVILATVGTASAASGYPGINYDIDSPPAPAPAAQNQLDIYIPDGISESASRPVVAYVHGGGWRQGDKANQIADKVKLFTDAGYVFATINYRLSPETLSANPDPGRVRFPDHPHDVGEAIGWLDRNVAAYGGDPERIALIGHSAGAHLVSLVATDPSYVEAYGVEPWQLIGAVPLDTGAFDVTTRIAELDVGGRLLYYNAFGTPAENAATGSWATASPISWTSAADPEQLLVTQAASAERIDENRRMAVALGQDPDGVFLAPYNHGGINAAVGDPADGSGETTAIVDFIARKVEEARPPEAELSKRPPKRLETTKRKAKAKFAFGAAESGSSFECRLDAGKLKSCRSPRKLRVGLGRHRFRVRAIAPSGRPGPVVRYRFRVSRA